MKFSRICPPKVLFIQKSKMASFMSGVYVKSGLERELFGGAMRCCLPNNVRDVSELREIPDNQEVFCHPSTDQSLMVDILEYQGHVQGESAVRYHFEDIAGSNNASQSFEVLSVELLQKDQLQFKQCQDAWMLKGRQQVSKFKETNTAKNVVNMFLVLYRLPCYGSDVIVTFNDPVILSPESSSHSTQPVSVDVWDMTAFNELVTSLSLSHPERLFGE